MNGDKAVTSTNDFEHLTAWTGSTESRTDTITQSALAGLSALLDYDAVPWPTGEAPPLGHWLSFLPTARQSDIDRDGHAKRGGFLPPVPLPRRMWAGGRLTFHNALPIDQPIERRSTISSVQAKDGATGKLVFVTVRHEFEVRGELAVTEEQDLVYRGEAQAPPISPAKPQTPIVPEPADITKSFKPDPVTLFRFSALTFNAHRIHYDRDFARDVEGYKGLVVHGPLLATLLMHFFLTNAPQARITNFNFRAQRPLLDIESADLCLAWREGGANVWSQNAGGHATMTAEIRVS